MKALLGLLAKLAFNVLNDACPSSILRARLLGLFGAEIGKNVKVERILLMHFDGMNLRNLILDDRVFVGPGTILDIKGKIHLRKSVKMGPGCNISTHVDAGKENPASQIYPAKIQDVEIGEGAWLGASVTILCGVKIGANAIVGAGSLVNKSVPPGSVAYGVPVKVRRQG